MRNILTLVPAKKEKQPLSVTHPKLALQAHGWDPSKISYGSKKQLLWDCELGHIYETSPNTRTNMKSGCPYCSNNKVLKGFNDLLTTHPDIAKEAEGWDASTVVTGSHDSKMWRCPLGHLWIAVVNSRTSRGDGCGVCAGRIVLLGYNDLLTKFPDLSGEADGWDPKTVSSGSRQRKSWKCKKGHTWEATVTSRSHNKSGCPYCSNNKVLKGFNDLLTTHKNLAKEADGWDPSEFSSGSARKKDWKCEIGHKWTYTIKDRVFGDGCPYCSGKRVLKGFNDLQTIHPNLANEAYDWDPSTLTVGSNKKRRWKCEFGHIWSANITSRTNLKSGCPSCSKSGFDPNQKGYIYFINHESWKMFQIGITNIPKDRIRDHERLGWEVVELRGPMDGHLTQQWETAILRMLKAKGADLSNSKIAGKFDGYSEAWSKSTFEVKSIKELMELTEEFEEQKLGD